MKRLILLTLSAILAVSALLVTGCVREELPDNRDTDYGYVQFKLYKEVSYENVTKASGDYHLDSLSQASKINVMLINSDGSTISQTLTLSAADDASAEFGLRSAKLRLLNGDYEVASYALYDNLDTQIGNRVAVGGQLTVSPGGLVIFDLTADVAPRGMIRFNLVKDLSGLTVKSRPKGEYTFDEISSVNITLINIDDQTQQVPFKEIPVSFSIHFSGDEHYDGNDGVSGNQTSSSQADSIVYAPAGNYKIYSYELLDSDDILLESQDFSQSFESQENTIVVVDNEVTEADVPVTLVEADAYLQDYYALREIWKALDGEHWYYEGQTWPKGSNWNFDKDPDLWGDQPGVQIHDNGRVASLDLSGFGISGTVPDAIGRLTELVQLSFGNHNETNRYHAPASDGSAAQTLYPVDGTVEEKAQWRKDKYKGFGKFETEPISPVCALALRMSGKTSSAASYYDNMSLDEISRMAASGATPTAEQIRPYDMNLGTATNDLRDISDAIGNLTRLESLSIANSPNLKVDGFPGEDVFGRLTSLTELEIYNCAGLETLPEGITALPNLITVNLSTNGFTPDGANKALAAIASGASEDVIQILYFLQNELTELPVEVGDMASLGMLNVTQNNIEGELPSFGEKFAPQELSFDDNQITKVPDDFCSLDALTSITLSYNDLTEFPNMFSSDATLIISTINVAHNKIKKLPDPGTFKGVRTNTLVLTGNPMDTFPTELSATDSFVEVLTLQSCGIKNFPEHCFDGENSHYLTTLDLQYNNLTDIPKDFNATTLPYMQGMDVSYNSFSTFPLEPLNILRMTAFGIRGQRDSEGERCLSDWPEGLYTHTGLRGFYIGSNDLRVIQDDSISTLIFYLDISDNPNIVFDAADVCSAWQAGAYFLYYDQGQEILNCDAMLD